MIEVIVKKLKEAITRFSTEYNVNPAQAQFVIYGECVKDDFSETENYTKVNNYWYATPKLEYTQNKFMGWKPVQDSALIAALDKKYHPNDLHPMPKFDFVKDYNKKEPLEKWVKFIKIYNEPVDLLNIGGMADMFIGGAMRDIAREHECQVNELMVFIGYHPNKKDELVLPLYIKGVQKGFISFAKLFGEEVPA